MRRKREKKKKSGKIIVGGVAQIYRPKLNKNYPNAPRIVLFAQNTLNIYTILRVYTYIVESNYDYSDLVKQTSLILLGMCMLGSFMSRSRLNNHGQILPKNPTQMHFLVSSQIYSYPADLAQTSRVA